MEVNFLGVKVLIGEVQHESSIRSIYAVTCPGNKTKKIPGIEPIALNGK